MKIRPTAEVEMKNVSTKSLHIAVYELFEWKVTRFVTILSKLLHGKILKIQRSFQKKKSFENLVFSDFFQPVNSYHFLVSLK